MKRYRVTLLSEEKRPIAFVEQLAGSERAAIAATLNYFGKWAYAKLLVEATA